MVAAVFAPVPYVILAFFGAAVISEIISGPVARHYLEIATLGFFVAPVLAAVLAALPAPMRQGREWHVYRAIAVGAGFPILLVLLAVMASL